MKGCNGLAAKLCKLRPCTCRNQSDIILMRKKAVSFLDMGVLGDRPHTQGGGKLLPTMLFMQGSQISDTGHPST